MKINESRILYKAITKENFDIIKELLKKGIKNNTNTIELSREISEKTGIPLDRCIGFVSREITGAKYI